MHGEITTQEMCLLQPNSATGQSTLVQKGIQAILVERGLWPLEGVRLECEKPKCATYQLLTTYTVYAKGWKCDSCKEVKDHSSHYTKQRICDACDLRKRQCQCVTKKYCTHGVRKSPFKNHVWSVKKYLLNAPQMVKKFLIFI